MRIYNLFEEVSEQEYPLDGFLNWQGIRIEIENKAGEIRRGVSGNFTPWETTMIDHYGRIPATEGNDGDCLDVYVKAERPRTNKVFRITQVNPENGKFDENKYLCGFNDENEAKDHYLKHYDRSDYFGGIKELNLDEFKKMIKKNRNSL